MSDAVACFESVVHEYFPDVSASKLLTSEYGYAERLYQAVKKEAKKKKQYSSLRIVIYHYIDVVYEKGDVLDALKLHLKMIYFDQNFPEDVDERHPVGFSEFYESLERSRSASSYAVKLMMELGVSLPELRSLFIEEAEGVVCEFGTPANLLKCWSFVEAALQNEIAYLESKKKKKR